MDQPRDAAARTFRMFPEWGASSPLWGSAEPDIGPDEGNALGLPDDLVSDLRAWNDAWQDALMTSSGEVRQGWAVPADEAAWAARGRALLARVRSAVGPDVRVGDEFSPPAHPSTGDRSPQDAARARR